MPRASNPLISTTRVDGLPSAPTVASVIALGSGSSAFSASSSHFANCCIGSSAQELSSSSSRS